MQRLKTLIGYQVLDTSPEPSYDDITRLASAICQTPIALVSLVDSDRQWFKSKVGLEASETPREVSFCGHAIYDSKVFVVEDAFKDERFADNPLVTGAPNVRFYAGAPLRAPDGNAIGSLCVIDHQPRKLSPEQLGALEVLASQVVRLMEHGKAARELKERFGELQKLSALISQQHEALVHGANMSSLGTMAANIAHEVNNPLTVILAKTASIRRQLRDGAPNPERLLELTHVLESTAHRISRVTKSLTLFARNFEDESVESIPLIELVGRVLDLCQEKLKSEKIEIFGPAASDVVVLCRPAQASQVLYNMIRNAADAIESVPEKWIRIECKTRESRGVIQVSDSGKGVPADIRSRIMEPFFTTKAEGKGAGMGLSVAQTLIQANGGSVEFVPDAPNTTFEMTLPKAEA